MDTRIQPKITGYRQLSEQEAALMNEIKAKGEELRELVLKLRENEGKANDEFGTPDFEPHRWISTGEMHLKQGLMALTRAVAKPTSF